MKKLTDICDIQYGYAFDSACFTKDSSYPPLVRIRDVNGACNILRKSKQDFDFEELCRGLLDSPLRIRVS